MQGCPMEHIAFYNKRKTINRYTRSKVFMIMMITRCKISNNYNHLLKYTYYVRLIAFVKEIETRTVEYLQEIFHLLVESR